MLSLLSCFFRRQLWTTLDNIFWEGIKESLSFVVNVVVFFYHCPVKLLKRKEKKKGLIPQMDSAQIVIFVFTTKIIDNMGKGTHFFGQPVDGQLIKCLNKDKIVEMSRNHGGER